MAAIDGPYASTITRIGVHLTQRLSSQDAQAGDTFGFDTSSSVYVDGYFLAAETHGLGIVRAASPARGSVPGKLVLETQTLDLPDGKKLAVGLAPGQLDRVLTRGAGSPVGAGSGTVAVTFGQHPTNVVYEKGTPFIVVAPPPPTAAPDDE